MAAVRDLREAEAYDVDLDSANQRLTATKSGEEVQLVNRETSAGSCATDVVGSNSVGASNGDDSHEAPAPLTGELGGSAGAANGCTRAASGVAQCNHVGESNSVANLSSSASSPVISSCDTACAVTNSVDDAGQAHPSFGAALTSADVNNSDAIGVSQETAVTVVSGRFQPTTAAVTSVSAVEGTLSAVKDVLSVQSTAPGSPHGVTLPSVRTNTVNMVVPAAVAPSAALRTLVPRIVVSTSPATTVLRVQTAAGTATTQSLPIVPSQQLILPVRNQGTAVPRVWCSFFVSLLKGFCRFHYHYYCIFPPSLALYF